MERIGTEAVMVPPRIIGHAVKPSGLNKVA